MQPIKELFLDENGLKQHVKCIRYTSVSNSENNPPSKYHYHEFLEIIYVVSGGSTMIIKDKEYLLSTGDIIIIPTNFNHVTTFKLGTEFVVVMCDPDELYREESMPYETKLLRNFLTSDSPYIFNISDIDNIALDNLFAKIVDEFYKKEYMGEMLILSYITELIVTLMRFYPKAKSDALDENEVPEIISQIISYVRENFDTVTAEETASKFNISYNYFSYLFRKHTNSRFIEYLTKIRLAEAKKYLLATKKSITEIANDVGFSTSSHFIMVFKKYNGISPNKFRTYYMHADRM